MQKFLPAAIILFVMLAGNLNGQVGQFTPPPEVELSESAKKFRELDELFEKESEEAELDNESEREDLTLRKLYTWSPEDEARARGKFGVYPGEPYEGSGAESSIVKRVTVIREARVSDDPSSSDVLIDITDSDGRYAVISSPLGVAMCSLKGVTGHKVEVERGLLRTRAPGEEQNEMWYSIRIGDGKLKCVASDRRGITLMKVE